MARLYYMALPGIGSWEPAMKESGAQLAPYRSYLATARAAALNRALFLAWRPPRDEELQAIHERAAERAARAARRSADARRRRDRHDPWDAASGTWVILEPRPGHPEDPESTFDAFLEAKEVHDRGPVRRGQAMTWPNHGGIAVRGFDREALGILLGRAPTPIPPRDASTPADGREAPAGPLLFLRPNTWPLECQHRALVALEDRPAPRLAPLLRLVSTRPSWPAVEHVEVPEDAWSFLRPEQDGSMRDGTTEQREFVRRALGTPDFAVLEGPPGSGKTTAICELIIQLTREHKRVLLVASTHVAVDNVLERLISWQDASEQKLVMPVRIGDDDKITSSAVAAWTLRNLIRTWSGEILDHLDQPRGGQPEGAAARQLLREALTRTGEESALARLLLDSSNLVCGTIIGILQHPAIKAARKEHVDIEPFDVMILDEASKTTFTEFLVPAAYAKRWIVVGDRRQLSPYVEEDDLAENVRGLLPEEVARATAHAFLASQEVPSGQRLRSLMCVKNAAEAKFISDEASSRGVSAVNLDDVEPTLLRGVNGACPSLLFADIVVGKAETIAKWEHRLPGDLEAVTGDVPALPSWEAHRRALRTHPPDTPVSWADEVAWRQVHAYALRYNEAEQRRPLEQLGALRPRTLGDWFFKHRGGRPRTLRDGRTQTPAESFDEELEHMRRVSMPSILEILQKGAGSLGWRDRTALTDGLSAPDLKQRMVSLSFQHRMHPDISAFPRARFYKEDGLLKDAAGMAGGREWGYRRYARRAGWIDIAPHGMAKHRNASGNTNKAEAERVMTELEAFVRWAATAPRSGKDPNAPWEVAVLSFYRGQEKELRERLQRLSGQLGNTRNFQLPRGSGRVHVTLCTVDRFQGHEADLVLLSFVKSGSAGFLNSPNRLNVALTRARYQVVLIGHRTWMASTDCRSKTLRDLGSSELYAHDIGWEHA